MTTAKIKQSNFQSQQNLKIDIDQIYNDFIKEIDSIRSYINPSSVTDAFYNSLKTKGKSHVSNQIQPEQTFQESRCHAFYRLLGLPVVGKDNKFYSPGHDIVKKPGVSRTITLSTKISIAQAQLDLFQQLSNSRESLPLYNLDIFSNNETIDAGVRALSVLSFSKDDAITGAITLRPFVTPIDDDDGPYKMNFSKYKIGHHTIVGNNPISGIDLRDVNNAEPSGKVFTSSHIIRPFIVDPRIDFTAENKVCVPFVIYESFTKMSSGVFAQTPFIERIINERLSRSDESAQGTYAANLKTFIDQNSSIADEDLIKHFTNGNTANLSEGLQQKKLLEFLKITSTIVSSLRDAMDAIADAQSKYYWLPVPSKSGPEIKASVRETIVSADISNLLYGPKDNDIIILSAKVANETRDEESLKSDGKVHAKNLVIGQSDMFKPANSSGFSEITTKNLNKLKKDRHNVLDKANEALRTIEIIMGEFSGLGLADIMAIAYALYIMPESDLLGLIDYDAFKRATLDGNLSLTATQSDIETSMKSLNNTVKQLYQLMDKIYLNSFLSHSSQN